VVGGDLDKNNLQRAREACRGRNNIAHTVLDARHLPFADNHFDVVILYEAIYYLNPASKFIEEARRVLSPNGVLIICTVNKDWHDFNPSPFSVKYFSVPELFALLNQHFLSVEFYGGFPVFTGSGKNKLLSFLKRTAISLHLMPKTMRGKELLKRIFFGKLTPLPDQIADGMAEYNEPDSIPSRSSNELYKVLYSVAYG
jgi:ubiquinone/menaquinone biosynthesis C-methylase UbiE